MRSLFLSLILVLGFGGAVLAQDRDIEATIGNQIEAFQADDFNTAFTFASPTIQGIFGTPENFGTMVKRGYPMVWRPAEVRYLDLREIAGRLWQKVMITDSAGVIHLLDYEMIQMENGWKINAVQMLDSTGSNA